MGTKMANQPVFYTLVQVKFNTIANMADYAPNVQEVLRHKGFPDYQSVSMQQMTIQVQNDGTAPVPVQSEVQRWFFHNAEKTSGYILLSDSLVYQSTAYENFPHFSTKLIEGLEIVSEAVGGLAFVERIGMRYLDAVIPNEGETLQQYLDTSLVGGLSNTVGRIGHRLTETLSFTETGTLIARSLITSGGLPVPPDLFPLSLSLDKKYEMQLGEVAVLDTDHFWSGRESFNLTSVKDRLDSLHTDVSTTFLASVTPFARKAWGDSGV